MLYAGSDEEMETPHISGNKAEAVKEKEGEEGGNSLIKETYLDEDEIPEENGGRGERPSEREGIVPERDSSPCNDEEQKPQNEDQEIEQQTEHLHPEECYVKHDVAFSSEGTSMSHEYCSTSCEAGVHSSLFRETMTKTSKVTITAGGITATVTTSEVQNEVATTSVSTAPSSMNVYSTISIPDLSRGVAPYTGLSTRSQKLQQLRISSLDNYLLDDEENRIHALTPLQVTYEGGTGMIFSRPAPANVVRKCVYMYEDKYSFSRVLQPGMLLFDSHFEGGNLHSAYLVSSSRDSERSQSALSHSFYDLYMHEDVTNATGAQWFYFSVSGNKAKQKVTFSIRNFYKPDSLFNDGMRPLVLSLKGTTSKDGKKRKGWTRAGVNISYKQETPEESNFNPSCIAGNGVNGKKQKKSQANRPTRSILTFTYCFEEAQDTCFFAFCHPYTYSDLQTYLHFAEGKLRLPKTSPRAPVVSDSKSQENPLFYYRTKLCETIAGNRCDLIVVSSLKNARLEKESSHSREYWTSSSISNAAAEISNPSHPLPPSSSHLRLDPDYYPISGLKVSQSMPHILITARVHPGETSASWSMQGFLDFILSSHFKAIELREKFVFLIVPMLNPDGVINGNNRTSLSGHDLNRNWRCPDPKRHPTIFHTKELVRSIIDKTSHDVILYLDLHGHSRQKGAFTYGCLPDRNDIPQIREFFSEQNNIRVGSNAQSARATTSASSGGIPNVKSTENAHHDSAYDSQYTTNANLPVGTKGILKGRMRIARMEVDPPVAKEVSEGCPLHRTPRGGQILHNNKQTEEAPPSSSLQRGDQDTAASSFSPLVLPLNSPTGKDKRENMPQFGLADAKTSMNVEHNMWGYSDNSRPYVFSSLGVSLETDNDKNAPHAFTSVEAESKCGKKEDRVRSLPRFFSKKIESFMPSYCSFKVPSSKLSTSRAVMALEIGIECSYTLEVSLAGDDKRLFQPTDLLNIGKSMGKCLHDWMHPALSYLEGKHNLEEQERIRKEQLEEYYNYNSRNKDIEGRMNSRARRPHSGNGCVKSSQVLQNNSIDSNNARSAPHISPCNTLSANKLQVEGYSETIPKHINDESSYQYGNVNSGISIVDESDAMAVIDMFEKQCRKKAHPENQLKEKTHISSASTDHDGSSDKRAAFTPTLQVRHPIPSYNVIDFSDRHNPFKSLSCQGIAPSNKNSESFLKKNSRKKTEKVPKLDLSIASKPTQCNNVMSSRCEPDTPSSFRGKRNPHARPSENLQKEIYSLGKDATSELPPAPMSSKSPRASSVKDSLKYAQSSKLHHRESQQSQTPRVVYKQQKPSHVRSVSAKSRKSPKMAMTKFSENGNALDSAHYQLSTKSSSKRCHSARQRNTFSRQDETKDESCTEKKSTRNSLASQLSHLRKEYEEHKKLLDSDLNLESNEIDGPRAFYSQGTMGNHGKQAKLYNNNIEL